MPTAISQSQLKSSSCFTHTQMFKSAFGFAYINPIQKSILGQVIFFLDIVVQPGILCLPAGVLTVGTLVDTTLLAIVMILL